MKNKKLITLFLVGSFIILGCTKKQQVQKESIKTIEDYLTGYTLNEFNYPQGDNQADKDDLITYITEYIKKENNFVKNINFLGCSADEKYIWYTGNGAFTYPVSYIIIDVANKKYIQIPAVKQSKFLINYNTGDCMYSNERVLEKYSLNEKEKRFDEDISIFHTNVFEQDKVEQIDTTKKLLYNFEYNEKGEVVYNKYEGNNPKEYIKEQIPSVNASLALYDEDNPFDEKWNYYSPDGKFRISNDFIFPNRSFRIFFSEVDSDKVYCITEKEIMNIYGVFGEIILKDFSDSNNEVWYTIYCDSPIPWAYIIIDLEKCSYKVIKGVFFEDDIVNINNGDCLYRNENKIYYVNLYNPNEIKFIDYTTSYKNVFSYGPNKELCYLNKNEEIVTFTEK